MPASGVWHVIPIDDLKDHETCGMDCWCNPDYDEEDNVILHNSLDGREAYESGQRKPH